MESEGKNTEKKKHRENYGNIRKTMVTLGKTMVTLGKTMVTLGETMVTLGENYGNYGFSKSSD